MHLGKLTNLDTYKFDCINFCLALWKSNKNNANKTCVEHFVDFSNLDHYINISSIPNNQNEKIFPKMCIKIRQCC